MILTSFLAPASSWKTGQEKFEVLNPANLRIVTTGDVPLTVLNEGPPRNRKWAVTLRVEVTETDA